MMYAVVIAGLYGAVLGATGRLPLMVASSALVVVGAVLTGAAMGFSWQGAGLSFALLAAFQTAYLAASFLRQMAQAWRRRSKLQDASSNFNTAGTVISSSPMSRAQDHCRT